MSKKMYLTFLLTFCLIASLPVYSAECLGSDNFVEGEIAVELKDASADSLRDISAFSDKYDFKITGNSEFFGKTGIMTVKTDAKNISCVIENLKKDANVKYAEPNYVYRAYAVPNDPLYRVQWNLKKINMEKAWMRSTGKNVKVAVIDTGVAYENYQDFRILEDLKKTKFANPYNFVTDTPHANDDNGHGSHVAGTIAQSTNNSKGVAGIAFNSVIMPIKVLNSQGSGKLTDIADGIKYAADNGAKVINMSLGGPYGSDILEDACKYAKKKGCVIICAAGNDKGTNPNYPAGYKECVSVSSVRYDNQLAFYSTRGKSIDIAAPGGDITVDQNGDGYPDGIMQNTLKDGNPQKHGYLLFQGTSMASPHVAGTAALMIAAGCKNPDKVIELLKKTAYKKGLNLEDGYGAGILDAEKAVNAAYGAGTFPFREELIILIMTVILVIIMKNQLAKYHKSDEILSSLPFIVGIAAGACGLFFLSKFMSNMGNPVLKMVCLGLTDWYIPFFGRESFLSLLFCSAVIPALLMFLSMPFKILRRLCIGIGLGTGASLLYAAFCAAPKIAVLSSFGAVENIWLFLNGAVCIALAYGAVKFLPESKS